VFIGILWILFTSNSYLNLFDLEKSFNTSKQLKSSRNSSERRAQLKWAEWRGLHVAIQSNRFHKSDRDRQRQGAKGKKRMNQTVYHGLSGFSWLFNVAQSILIYFILTGFIGFYGNHSLKVK
jgi:hypothetical protein